MLIVAKLSVQENFPPCLRHVLNYNCPKNYVGFANKINSSPWSDYWNQSTIKSKSKIIDI